MKQDLTNEFMTALKYYGFLLDEDIDYESSEDLDGYFKCNYYIWSSKRELTDEGIEFESIDNLADFIEDLKDAVDENKDRLDKDELSRYAGLINRLKVLAGRRF